MLTSPHKSKVAKVARLVLPNMGDAAATSGALATAEPSSWRTRSILAAVAAICSIALSSTADPLSQHQPTTDGALGLVSIPDGREDTFEDGLLAARDDIAAGKIQLAVFGLTDRSVFDHYKAYGVTPLLMGCLIGGHGTDFWAGYNREVRRFLGIPGRLQVLPDADRGD